jgi:branched-chain amino acid transport system substrate-binding protein
MSPFDSAAVQAAVLEVGKINKRGGVLGRRLQMKICNTQLDPAKGKACAAKLISQGAVAVLTTCDVEFGAPATQETINSGRLAVASCVGTDEQGPKRFGAKGRLAFTLGNVAQDEGSAMAEYGIKRGWKRAITVTDNLLEYFRDVVEAFTVRYKELGGAVVLAESFTNGDKTIQNVVSRVAGTQADIIATSTTFGDWPVFVQGLRSLGNNTAIINSWAGDGTFWYPKDPPVTNYYYVTYASIFGNDPDPEVNALVAEMKKAGKPPATGSFVTGAAAIDAIVAAIARTGSTKGSVLARAFEQFQGLSTISGNVSYSPTLHAVFGRVYRVIKVDNNKAKFVGLVTARKLAKIKG